MVLKVAARPSKFQALEITSKLSWWGGVTALLTLLWTFWNPTWDRARRARARGKVPDVRLATPFIVSWIFFRNTCVFNSLQ